jgi:carboxylesterase
MMIKDYSYRIEGGRTGVLLIHGLGGTPSELRFVANGLARDGLTVHCPQLAGHGGSEEDLKASGWQDWYRSAEDALNTLSKTCDTVIVGGLSTGAILGLLLAARNPDVVDGLSLYSPTLWLSGNKVPWYLPLFRMVNNKALANLFRFPVPSHVGIKDQRIRDFICNARRSIDSAPIATPGGVVLERRRLATTVIKMLGKIKKPTLVIHAKDDDYAGLDNASYLQTKLGGPVDLTVLDDSYHMVTVDRQRHVVVERTASFVARLSDATAKAIEKTKTFRPTAPGFANPAMTVHAA